VDKDQLVEVGQLPDHLAVRLAEVMCELDRDQLIKLWIIIKIAIDDDFGGVPPGTYIVG
jgi:hypothetical protein